MSKIASVLILTISACFLVAGTAMAVPLNNALNPISSNGHGDDTLQTIVDNVFGENVLDVNTDQTGVGGWGHAESDTSTYKLHIQGASGGTGTTARLGIYDLNSDNEYLFGTQDTSFKIWNGNLNITGIGNVASPESWSSTFGFYLQYDGKKYYTEDDKNTGGDSHAVSYLLDHGTTWNNDDYWEELGVANNGGTLKGWDDWLMAFDINDPGSLEARDFNELVVLVEDMSAVPEPATMVLLGIGLLGLAGITRKKNKV